MEEDRVMSRRTSCPNCGKQLSVRPELIGKKVVCPRCSNQFRYSSAPTDEPTSVVEVAPPNPHLFPPDTKATPHEAPSNNSVSRPAKSTSPRARPAEPSAAKPAKHPPEADRRGLPPGSPTNTAETAAPPPTDQQDQPQTARFIQRDVNATKVELGEDGQLPDLALAKRDRRDDVATEAKTSNPWLLIAVLCTSVSLSVLILLVDQPGPAQNRTRADALEQVESIFASWDRTDASALEVRDLLASALQAHNRGDNEQECEYYRRVLDYLNREDAPKYGGFSGDDKKLKELLNELLR
jgi:hypothetical protein